MLGLTVKTIAEYLQGKLNDEKFAEIVVDSVTTDSRKAGAGVLFIPLQGEKVDGHEFVAQVAKLGGCALVSKMEYTSAECACIIVRDTLASLQALAHCIRMKYPIPVVAITGSNGKTTTKEMIASVLSERLCVLKNEGNFNNEIGLPLTLLQLESRHECAVVEMGMRGAGQITELCGIAMPDIGVVTNVGQSHIELLGSVDNIAQAKSELPRFLNERQLVVLNGDDDRVRSMAKHTRARVLMYGTQKHNDIRALDIVATSTGLNFKVNLETLSFDASIPAVGVHNVLNALAAIAVGWELGLNAQELVRGLRNYQPAGMRMAVRQSGGITIIEDCYNASPLSMNAALDTLALFEGRKIAVLADMLELGDYSEQLHREVGIRVAETKVAALITYGAQSEFIADAARAGGIAKVMAFTSHDDVRAFLLEYCQEGDVILFKGSRGMALEEVASLFA